MHLKENLFNNTNKLRRVVGLLLSSSWDEPRIFGFWKARHIKPCFAGNCNNYIIHLLLSIRLLWYGNQVFILGWNSQPISFACRYTAAIATQAWILLSLVYFLSLSGAVDLYPSLYSGPFKNEISFKNKHQKKHFIPEICN